MQGNIGAGRARRRQEGLERLPAEVEEARRREQAKEALQHSGDRLVLQVISGGTYLDSFLEDCSSSASFGGCLRLRHGARPTMVRASCSTARTL